MLVSARALQVELAESEQAEQAVLAAEATTQQVNLGKKILIHRYSKSQVGSVVAINQLLEGEILAVIVLQELQRLARSTSLAVGDLGDLLVATLARPVVVPRTKIKGASGQVSRIAAMGAISSTMR